MKSKYAYGECNICIKNKFNCEDKINAHRMGNSAIEYKRKVYDLHTVKVNKETAIAKVERVP